MTNKSLLSALALSFLVSSPCMSHNSEKAYDAKAEEKRIKTAATQQEAAEIIGADLAEIQDRALAEATQARKEEDALRISVDAKRAEEEKALAAQQEAAEAEGAALAGIQDRALAEATQARKEEDILRISVDSKRAKEEKEAEKEIASEEN